MKIKPMTHMLLLLLMTLQTSTSEEVKEKEEDQPPPVPTLSVFYKNKFFVLYPQEDKVEVYEEYMIPYATLTKHVFFPRPDGNITAIRSHVKDKILVLTTADGKDWYYERLKLRKEGQLSS